MLDFISCWICTSFADTSRIQRTPYLPVNRAKYCKRTHLWNVCKSLTNYNNYQKFAFLIKSLKIRAYLPTQRSISRYFRYLDILWWKMCLSCSSIVHKLVKYINLTNFYWIVSNFNNFQSNLLWHLSSKTFLAFVYISRLHTTSVCNNCS